MKVTFFASPSAFHRWLAENHDKAAELWVGFHKKQSGKPSITYQQALDEALCFGWIDGVRKSVDESSYTIRFTPRKPKSVWSVVNIKRARELMASGRMQPPGLKAFEKHDPEKSKQYSYEERTRGLDAGCERQFRANARAWDFFQSQPPGYQRMASWWVMSAKKEETRLKRLAALIEISEKGSRLPQLIGQKKSQ
ncbi:MAG TPA: YdeI/OmpD-associated family protein [Thermoanaerobaculia bacterium]|jgi:uncharacterized protein YdeI (YjbR/CyaY-like superfamily)